MLSSIIFFLKSGENKNYIPAKLIHSCTSKKRFQKIKKKIDIIGTCLNFQLSPAWTLDLPNATLHFLMPPKVPPRYPMPFHAFHTLSHALLRIAIETL
jgi:hypothetical protein